MAELALHVRELRPLAHGVGVGLTFAMIPSLIIRSVPSEETGSATGLNQVPRLIGVSIGSAASIAILGMDHLEHLPIPRENGYTIAFASGALICVIAAAVCFALIRETRAASPESHPAH